ncbi:HD domain-containing protein [Luteolibacter yonseiensis]|uniref:HD domain-containing protein n=1 Tax=Luteolibacter yonseiensis TaxID=1144680 RepID=A0A934R2Y6_9BACT|nr:HD domain-containing protein [Luteolibacter yonseiensis]MBK1817428.1 HD domain-containing protein [Luteolibacter yonseiensis]
MSFDSVNTLQTAAALAAKAHAGQTIRNTDIPYIAHAMGVSMAVTCLFGCTDPEVAAAALLHDTLEKTRLTGAEIRETLGPRVLHLVVAMTKDDGYAKAEYWERLYDEVWEARLIKMADALDHLDCPADELPRRIKSGRRALELAYSEEIPIQTARRVLGEALASAVERATGRPTLQ